MALEHLQCNVEAALAARLYEQAAAADQQAADRLAQLAGMPTQADDASEQAALQRDRQIEESLVRNMQDTARQLHREADRAVATADSLDTGTDPAALEPIQLVPLTKDELAERRKRERAAPWATLRDERNMLLASSDWTQLTDIPTNVQMEWAAYRQKLRDLPAKTDNPAKVKWPKPPA
jgi:Phage tail assembly chaperone protein